MSVVHSRYWASFEELRRTEFTATFERSREDYRLRFDDSTVLTAKVELKDDHLRIHHVVANQGGSAAAVAKFVAQRYQRQP